MSDKIEKTKEKTEKKKNKGGARMDEKAMYKIGYGLYVLTAKDKKDNGCILNTVMQITENPNRIAVAVNKLNLTNEMIKETKAFNVSMLTTEASFEIFRRFGYQSGRDVNKFADYNGMKRAENGIYYITETTNAYLSAKVSEMIDCGSHTMFIAEVVDGVILGEGDTVTYDYYQKNIKPKPQESKKSGYRCRICGYIYEGDVLPADFVCPVCKHGAADFEKI